MALCPLIVFPQENRKHLLSVSIVLECCKTLKKSLGKLTKAVETLVKGSQV